MRICCQFSLEVLAFCGLLACRKTALMLALCEALRDKYSIAAVSALFLPYTPKYNLCSPRPSHHHEQLERNKRSETRWTWTCEIMLQLWQLHYQELHSEEIWKNDDVVKGACVTFVEAFPLTTTVVSKKLSDLYPVVAGNKWHFHKRGWWISC
jgi:hypothetical protein